MPTTNFFYAQEGVISSITVPVTEGSEPALGTAVNISGAPSVSARGVVFNSRNGYITVALLGQIPVKVATGQTIVAGSPVAVNASGEIIVATATTNVLGIALESITSAPAGSFLEVFVNSKPYIA